MRRNKLIFGVLFFFFFFFGKEGKFEMMFGVFWSIGRSHGRIDGRICDPEGHISSGDRHCLDEQKAAQKSEFRKTAFLNAMFSRICGLMRMVAARAAFSNE
jgi:hypothetical protein